MRRSINFNKEFKDSTLNLAAKMYGVKDGSSLFGGIPTSLRFGVTFSTFMLREIAKVTLPLNDDEYNSVKSVVDSFRKELIKEKKVEELENPLKK